MFRGDFLRLAGIGTAAAACGCTRPPRKEVSGRPNFLFILADDMGWRQCSPYGSSYYRTPNLERLARQGMKFTAAYAACPVCSPTRASIMTGKYPARLHLTDFIPGNPYPDARLKTPEWQKYLPLDEQTLAEALKELGYQTASFGKWHLSSAKQPPASEPYNPDKQGFDEYLVTYKPRRDSDPEADPHNVAAITEKSLAFIEANRDRPFFLYVTHNIIHDPVMAPADLVAGYNADPASASPENNPTLAAMMASLDASVGRLLDRLDELGLAENTVVIFFSDNGGLERAASQAPLRGGKAQLYEGGVRVPLLVRWPGEVAPGSVSPVPVASIDFFPTLLEVAGAPNRDPLVDGKSLVSVLQGDDHLDREALFWHYPHYHGAGVAPSGAVRKGKYKLIEWYDDSVAGIDGRFALYDLENDLGEQKNLAGTRPEKVQELSGMLDNWRREVGAQMPLPNPDYDTAMVP